ncbi:DUF3500 domain-containing protein [Chitinophagaceae bacterium LB-8]|uniref:DUF3500 domain-containing protein n=1 Tax=Paraflavisolibacter caeni TaxID=2982496 RepID=A0A9X2Y101_9BACT|nr:DUF3500 domain-containing protein [Paraflavisolibacter caeni]MCU7552700.1 DUF3500 domain-containing protein [Paraflavisolibacter caeni]
MKALILLFVLCFLTPPVCSGQINSFSSLATQFLNSLNGQQRNKVLYKFGDDEHFDWHFIPKSNRKGILLRELNEKQKAFAFTLLKSYLSDQAFRQTQEIIQLEWVLQELENRPKDDWFRDPGNYAFIFFGQPSDKTPWGWRFEGHHISFTFSTLDNRITSGTPGFLGANPAIVLSGPQKGKQVLKDEATLGFQLLGSLSPQQLAKAVISSEAPGDIITAASRKAMIEKPQGIIYSELNGAQQKLFLQLLSVYIHRYTKTFAAEMMQEIEQAGLEKLQFAWAGAREHAQGKPHYYRIQGPTIIIEYDNTQNNANHIHTVVRDLKHDFGGDELLHHYQKSH